MIQVDKANLACHCAASERSRYAFNGIAFTREGTVSTDGKSMLVVPYPKAIDDFPILPGYGDADPFATEAHYIADVKELKSASVDIKHKEHRTVMHHAAVALNGTVKVATVTSSLATTPNVERVVSKIEGAFPRWQTVVPKEENLRDIGPAFNPRVLGEALIELAKVMELRSGADNDMAVRIRTSGMGTPMLIEPVAGPTKDTGLLAVVMPVTLRK